VARHLHLPLQSGDREVLKGMRRPYSPRQYLDKVRALKEALDRPALSTDLMVGFPGEDETAFGNSLAVLEEAGVSRVHVFPYSPRRGTEAASRPQVSDKARSERVRRALGKAKSLKAAYDRGFLGTSAEVLVETIGEKPGKRAGGLTSRYQKVTLEREGHPVRVNTFVTVELVEYADGRFKGRALKENSR
jgi:threonylcarbamoyladenosine tRNA methylthiotransferase MtaB